MLRAIDQGTTGTTCIVVSEYLRRDAVRKSSAEMAILRAGRIVARICRMLRRPEPALDWDSANGIMAMLMRIDARVEEILWIVRDDDGEETTDTAPDA